MRKLFAFAVFLMLSACESVEDCMKNSGSMTSKTVDVPNFDKVTVYNGIKLVITDGPEHMVTIVSGENLINDIDVQVINGMLMLRDNTGCNWRRTYDATTVFITSPLLTEIHSKTERSIVSENTLTYPHLKLVSLDLSDGAGTGDFEIDVDNAGLLIETNNVSGFYISGQTETLSLGFYEGNGPLRAENLIAKHINIFHRGSNNMYIHPVESVVGDLYSTGNVFCNPQPPVVDVTEHYQGRLFFE